MAKNPNNVLAIGLMSGTSFDGVDASLIYTDGQNHFEAVADYHIPYHSELHKQLKGLDTSKCEEWLHVENIVTDYHYQCVESLLKKAGISNDKIKIIGFHGQTIYHAPHLGSLLQIGNAYKLAYNTGIDVIADFRRADMARGGNGAPLVPVFHQCLMQDVDHPVVVLNIGGVANITYIDGEELIACDTGPGNALINDITWNHYGLEYDNEGAIARSGKVHDNLVQKAIDDPFFVLKPPKSLDRNHFKNLVHAIFTNIEAQDVIASLTEITARSIVRSLLLLPKIPTKIYVCGGGHKNLTLMDAIRRNIAEITSSTNPALLPISHKNLSEDFVESQAFAYLAVRTLYSIPSTYPTTTGTSQGTVAGVLFSASSSI